MFPSKVQYANHLATSEWWLMVYFIAQPLLLNLLNVFHSKYMCNFLAILLDFGLFWKKPVYMVGWEKFNLLLHQDLVKLIPPTCIQLWKQN